MEQPSAPLLHLRPARPWLTNGSAQISQEWASELIYCYVLLGVVKR